MQSNRRRFLGAIAGLLAMPAVGKIIPITPETKSGRGLNSAFFTLDESAFQPVIGKSGQILVSNGAGTYPEWRDPEDFYIKSDKKSTGFTPSPEFIQTYNIPLIQPDQDAVKAVADRINKMHGRIVVRT